MLKNGKMSSHRCKLLRYQSIMYCLEQYEAAVDGKLSDISSSRVFNSLTNNAFGMNTCFRSCVTYVGFAVLHRRFFQHRVGLTGYEIYKYQLRLVVSFVFIVFHLQLSVYQLSDDTFCTVCFYLNAAFMLIEQYVHVMLMIVNLPSQSCCPVLV